MKIYTDESSKDQGQPAKIKAAFEALNYCERVVAPIEAPFASGVSAREGRQLGTLEARVKDAALMTLLEYFNSDRDGRPMPEAEKGNPEDPQAPVTQNA